MLGLPVSLLLLSESLLLLLPVVELFVFTTTSRLTPSIHTSISSFFLLEGGGSGVGIRGTVGGERLQGTGDVVDIEEDGAEGAGADLDKLRRVSRKLARGGRKWTPLRVEPSIAF